MEISKTSTIDLTEIRVAPKRAELTTRFLALDVGQAFEVSDIERGNLVYYQTVCRKAGRTVTMRKIDRFKYLVARIA